MKTKPLILPIVLILISAAWFVAANGRAERPERPSRKVEVIILQSFQNLVAADNGMGKQCSSYDEILLMRGNGSSGAPQYPVYQFGDVEAVTGRTNARISFAQTLSDLRSDGWRMVQWDGYRQSAVLEKP